MFLGKRSHLKLNDFHAFSKAILIFNSEFNKQVARYGNADWQAYTVGIEIKEDTTTHTGELVKAYCFLV